MIAPRIDRDVVLCALTARAVLDRFGVVFRDQAGQHRTNLCARCGERSRRDAVSVCIETGLWTCHVCGASGDVLALLAGYAGLDARTDFPRVLELAADIAGVGPVIEPAELERMRQTRRDIEARQRVEREADEAQRLEEAKFRSAAEWKRLIRNRHHQDGDAYLRGRGLYGWSLVEAGAVRFAASGDVCVPLYGFDGDLVNVVRRVLAPAEDAPKVLGLGACPTTGTLLGRVQDIIRGAVVMLVEGVFDALTALQLWPDRVIVGAHGAGRLPAIAAAIAPRIVEAAGTLWLVPHRDDTGERWTVRAGEVALAAGLSVDHTLRILELEHKDLNDAHRAGWKP